MPICEPATVIDSTCDPGVLQSPTPDINTASYEPAFETLPDRKPAVTTTLPLCPSARRPPTLHVTDESDCHPVASPAVLPHRALIDAPVAPIPPPDTCI